MDYGIMIIAEDELDELDDLFDNDIDIHHNLISGRNINTGCYVLFLFALDTCDHLDDQRILNMALEALEIISDSVLFNALTLHYPLTEVSYSTIIRLAKCIVILGKATRGLEAQNVPDSTVNTLNQVILNTLELRPDVRIIQ